MKRLTLATVGFERYAKTTRRAAFLAQMERVVPSPSLCRLATRSALTNSSAVKVRLGARRVIPTPEIERRQPVQ